MFKFQVLGNKYDIKLIQTFTKEGWSISELNNSYYLSVSDLDFTEIDIRNLRDKASEYIKLLNGIAKIYDGDHINISLGSLCEFRKDGSIGVFMEAKDTIKVRTRMSGNLEINGESQKSESTIEKYRIIAENNILISDALHFFQEINWWNLYKVYEVIAKDLGGEKEVINFGGPGSDIKRFKQTANSKESIGDGARHSKDFKANKNPMNLEDAYELFRKLLKKWIESKK